MVFYAPYSSKFEWLDTNNTLQKLVKLEKAFSKLPKPPCFFAGAWGVARELGTVGNYNQGPVRCVLRLSMGESRTDIQLNHPGIQKGRSYGVVLQSRAPLRKEVKHWNFWIFCMHSPLDKKKYIEYTPKSVLTDLPRMGWISKSKKNDNLLENARYLLPWEPKTFIFRGYNPYIGGLKPSFFMVLGSKGSKPWIDFWGILGLPYSKQVFTSRVVTTIGQDDFQDEELEACGNRS